MGQFRNEQKTKWVSTKWTNKLNAKQTKINYVSNDNGKETKQITRL